MAEALSDKTIEIVKSTVSALEAGGTAITDRMYQLMFRHAEVRALFNQSHHGETGSQSKALTAAIIAYAQAGCDYDERGLITGSWLARNTPIEEAAYYLCGPRPFLRGMVGGLARTGVALNRISYEFFGPADELLAA